MHKSKLAGFIIDCQTDDLESAAHFWGAALGMPVRELPPERPRSTRGSRITQHGLNIEVQNVSHPAGCTSISKPTISRPKSAGLEKLGAKRIQAVQTWLVMEAPPDSDFAWYGPSGISQRVTFARARLLAMTLLSQPGALRHDGAPAAQYCVA